MITTQYLCLQLLLTKNVVVSSEQEHSREWTRMSSFLPVDVEFASQCLLFLFTPWPACTATLTSHTCINKTSIHPYGQTTSTTSSECFYFSASQSSSWPPCGKHQPPWPAPSLDWDGCPTTTTPLLFHNHTLFHHQSTTLTFAQLWHGSTQPYTSTEDFATAPLAYSTSIPFLQPKQPTNQLNTLIW